MSSMECVWIFSGIAHCVEFEKSYILLIYNITFKFKLTPSIILIISASVLFVFYHLLDRARVKSRNAR